MTKIWGCVIVYNNADYLRATLESIKILCDGIIIIDGKYEAYPGKYHYSTDGSYDIILDFIETWKNDVDITFIPAKLWKTQVEKRNAYLEHDEIDVGDWLFVIDGDEALICRNAEDTRKELAELYHQGRALVRISNYSDRFRFFVKTEGMRYEGYHWNVIDPATGENVNDLVDAAQHIYGKPIKTAEIAHFKHQRHPQVKRDKEAFYIHRKPIEDPHIQIDMYNKALKLQAEGKLDE